MSASGLTGETFYYLAAAADSGCAGNHRKQAVIQIGSARVISSANSVNASAVLFLQSRGVTVSTDESSAHGTGRCFPKLCGDGRFQATRDPFKPGFAIANASFDPVQVSIQLTDLDVIRLPLRPRMSIWLADGQRTLFINQLFPGLPAEFQGIVRVTAPSAVTVASLRAKYNERNDLLMTASPVLNEGKGPQAT
jgi:hypothetical protein